MTNSIFRRLVSAFPAVAAVAVLTLVAGVSSLQAQPKAAKFVDSARVEIEKAFAASDTARLARAVVLLERALVVFPADPYLLHYRGYAAYRQVINRLNAGQVNTIGPIIARGLADLNKSAAKLPWPETIMLQSSFTAFQIAADPSRGRDLGMQIGMLTQQASMMAPNNPRVLLMQAYGAQNTPPEYGGGPAAALAFVNKAVAAFEKDHPAELAPNWGREEALRLQKVLSGAPGKPVPR